MLGTKYLKLLFYLIVCILGYLVGLYIGYKKVFNYFVENVESPEHSPNQCYGYRKVPKPCV
tara:strand:+ start:411 stop:593 length:183 start_codon:yes stop_codon:yes gene_type:complete